MYMIKFNVTCDKIEIQWMLTMTEIIPVLVFICKTQLHTAYEWERVCVSVYWPSVLIFRAVLTRANRVALKVTVPSLLRGMFMATSLCQTERETDTIREKMGENTPNVCVCVRVHVCVPCRPHGEDKASQIPEEAGSSGVKPPRPSA